MVVDASAVLALLRDEEGADVVAELLTETEKTLTGHSGLISAVNWTEVVQVATPKAIAGLKKAGGPFSVVDFNESHAEKAASFREPTKHLGLSLADRACLALGAVTTYKVVTADGDWLKADLGVKVRHIRPDTKAAG
ncbi:MAG: type II toxin-antitoxin system VapC family toxin [Solirubrobacteraceae bacterium]